MKIPIQQKPGSTLPIKPLFVVALFFGAWVHASSAYGMGQGELVDGNLESQSFNTGIRACVREGRYRTGLGVEAISYAGVFLTCKLWNQVDGLVLDPNWCSTWVVPNAPDECTPPPPTRGSPILLDLDRNQFHLSAGPVSFDINADGESESVSWVSAGTQDGFLYLDRNGNGIVDDGSELFGDSTVLFSGSLAAHGYEALAEFDRVMNGGNADRKLDAADSVYSQLMNWIDSNAIGIRERQESQSPAEAGVISIGLNYRQSRRTDAHGNEFWYIGKGVIDVNGRLKGTWTTDAFFRIYSD